MSHLPFTPDFLHKRHQLTYRQIDSLFGTDNHDKYKSDDVASMFLIRELILLIEALQAQNIQFIPLKGPVLSKRVYQDATMRKSHDLDFLIDFNDIDVIRELMIQMGYRVFYDADMDKSDKKKLFYNFKHLKFFNPVSKIVLEFHWRLFTYDVFVRKDTSSFIEVFTMEMNFFDKNIRVLKPEFELLYLTIHGATHKWSALKWLADTHDYLKNVSFNNVLFQKYVQAYRAQRILALYDKIVVQFFPNPLLFGCSKKVPKFLVNNCLSEIENVEFPDEDFSDVVYRSFNKLKYQYLLIPHCRRRWFLIKKYIIRDLRFFKIKHLIQKKLFRKA